ncbi:MAG: LA_3696 family protein [Thermacetogeniaceae bacterium]
MAALAELLIIPEVLRSKLGDEGARELIQLINRAASGIKESLSEAGAERLERRLMETKTDLEKQLSETKTGLEKQLSETKAELEKQLSETKTEFKKQLSETKTELEKQIAETKAELEKQIANTRADLIKWMFVFWAGQIVVITGLLSLFYNLLK